MTLVVRSDNPTDALWLLIQVRIDTVYVYQAELAVWLRQQDKLLQTKNHLSTPLAGNRMGTGLTV